MRGYRKDVKEEVFAAYGGYVCKCCGETEPLFLDIDHVNNDGSEHRRKNGISSGGQFYIWLKNNNFPSEFQWLKNNNFPSEFQWLKNNNFPSEFQVLCCNCNRGKYRNKGICPHQENYGNTST